jgi:hypothetical protein
LYHSKSAVSDDLDLDNPVFDNLDFDYPVINEPDPILMDYWICPTFDKILALDHMSNFDTGIIILGNCPIWISLSGLKCCVQILWIDTSRLNKKGES